MAYGRSYGAHFGSRRGNQKSRQMAEIALHNGAQFLRKQFALKKETDYIVSNLPLDVVEFELHGRKYQVWPSNEQVNTFKLTIILPNKKDSIVKIYNNVDDVYNALRNNFIKHQNDKNK